MALDPIWQQQLTLVTYGNEYLNQKLNFSQWIEHPIFNQHQFSFRDLNTQQLLAQHFQIWLEGLKAQGITHLSLHSSQLLLDESNPNAQVELIPYAHFIVSHSRKQSQAWIFGKELAAWYQREEDYFIPYEQRGSLRHETLWHFELNQKLLKRVRADLQVPEWDDIDHFMQTEIFHTPFSQACSLPDPIDTLYYGYTLLPEQKMQLPLLPPQYPADYAHQMLHHLTALSRELHAQQSQALHPDGIHFSADDHLKYRHFIQKLDDLSAKFIVKIANHYKTARLSRSPASNPADSDLHSQTSISAMPQKTAKFSSVLGLMLITAILCAAGYYFGF